MCIRDSGYTVPSEFKKIIETLLNKVPNIDKATLSTHCHNDLGLAVANSLAGVMAGARQIECTINGIGERAGNAALEEVVMAMRTRHDLMPYTTNINTKLISKASKVVSNALAGVASGARQVECTINGIGEIAGNAALEEIVMAIRTRNDLMPVSYTHLTLPTTPYV